MVSLLFTRFYYLPAWLFRHARVGSHLDRAIRAGTWKTHARHVEGAILMDELFSQHVFSVGK